MRLTIRRSALSAAHIITDCNFSRDDILETYGIPSEHVTAVPLAASSKFKPITESTEIERVRRKYKIDGDYILTVGSIQPRKNIPRLIKAYAMLCQEHSLDPLPKLVVVGKRAWLYEDTVATAASSSVSDKIIFTDYIGEKDLQAIYSAARCFVYPSYFEGFGIPPLEAMRCGTPTITGNTTCFPEIIGDAGLMVDTFDERAIMNAMVSVLTDLKLRCELIEKGLKRANSYDWIKTAHQTLAVYEKVNASNHQTIKRRRKA
jgi:glycosyltransferase involved in cell wall biosynthesis